MKKVALIPARSGSKRVPHKNIMPLGKHPLIAYSILAAQQSGVFDLIVCATDNSEYAKVAEHYGAHVPKLRPTEISGDKSPDIDWVRWVLIELAESGHKFEAFSILRPTSPFRRPETIRKAWDKFTAHQPADSLRAIEKCKEHPGKMWTIQDQYMSPLMPHKIGATPWHSSQYSALPEIYVQNASLEFAWTKTVLEKNSIAGELVVPFISEQFDGFDINNPDDWVLAQHYLEKEAVELLKFNKTPYLLKKEI